MAIVFTCCGTRVSRSYATPPGAEGSDDHNERNKKKESRKDYERKGKDKLK